MKADTNGLAITLLQMIWLICGYTKDLPITAKPSLSIIFLENKPEMNTTPELAKEYEITDQLYPIIISMHKEAAICIQKQEICFTPFVMDWITMLCFEKLFAD